MARESWLRIDNDNHDQVAEAIMCCQGFQPACFSGGFCAYEGDCFRSEKRAYREAAKVIVRASSDQSPMVKIAMREAAAHMLVCATGNEE